MYSRTVPVTRVQPSRTQLNLPAISEEVTWNDVSELLLRFPLENDIALSLKRPIVTNDTLILCVAWAEGDNQYRYKLWDGGVLEFPLYNGERIGPNAYIEVWSAGDFSAEMGALTLESSWLNSATGTCCRSCDVPIVEQDLVAEDFTTIEAGEEGNPFAFPYIT